MKDVENIIWRDAVFLLADLTKDFELLEGEMKNLQKQIEYLRQLLMLM